MIKEDVSEGFIMRHAVVAVCGIIYKAWEIKKAGYLHLEAFQGLGFRHKPLVPYETAVEELWYGSLLRPRIGCFGLP